MGKNIETRTFFHQPDFEDGHKGPVQIMLRRLAKQPLLATHAPQIADILFGSMLSPEIRIFKEKLNTRPDLSDPSLALLLKNTIFLPKEVFLRASPFHIDNWLRDSFVSSLSLNDLPLEKHLLDNFVNRRNKVCQVPTTRLFAGDRAWYFDDESTALALIWRAKLANLGYPLENDEIENWTGILKWVQNHVTNGFYITPSGTGKSWFDTFVFPDKDAITYNQGLYAVALLAANRLGLSIGDDEIKQAIGAYNALTNASGGLQLSRKVPYTDVSALFGEFLAHLFFNQPLLVEDTVKKTLQSFIPEKDGYKVVSRDDGTYLHPSEFNRPYQPGDYHNGADWPSFDMVAQAVAAYHGLAYDEQFVIGILRRLLKTENAEYIKTNIVDKDTPPYNPERTNHAWNSCCYTIGRRLLGPKRYQETLLASAKPKPSLAFLSEASQYPNSSL